MARQRIAGSRYPTAPPSPPGRTANQVFTLAEIGVLPSAPVVPALARPFVAGSAGAQARAYLHANCAICHRPGGPAPGDLRAQQTLAGTQMCLATPASGDLGVAD